MIAAVIALKIVAGAFGVICLATAGSWANNINIKFHYPLYMGIIGAVAITEAIAL